MVATWSDNDSSGSESEHEEIANLYLMTRESSEENNGLEEVTLEYLLTFSEEYLA